MIKNLERDEIFWHILSKLKLNMCNFNRMINLFIYKIIILPTQQFILATFQV
jgi:hypothetical protein